MSVMVPADSAVNDILIVLVLADVTITRPSNFTPQVSGVIAGLNYDASSLVIKHADIGAIYNWGFSSPTANWGSLDVLTRNVTALDGTLTNTPYSGTDLATATGRTTANPGELVLCFFLAMQEVGVLNYPQTPAGMTLEAAGFSRGSITSAFLGYQQIAAGPTGDIAVQWDAACSGATLLATISPSAAGAVIFEAGGTTG